MPSAPTPGTPSASPTARAVPHASGAGPVLGHVLPFLRDRLGFFQRVRRDGPLVQVRFGPIPAYVVNGPELLHAMLTSQADAFDKGRLGDKLRLFGENTLPIADGREHLTRRRLLQPAFHRAQVAGYVEGMRRTAEKETADWRDGETFDLLHRLQRMTQDVVMDVLYSDSPERERAEEILIGVDGIFRAAIRRVFTPIAPPKWVPTPRNRRIRRVTDTVHTHFSQVIERHRAHPDRYQDLVSLLLAARDEEGRQLPNEEVLAEMTAFLAAGTETTAVTLGWLFHELARHPEYERRLHEEVDTVLAGGPITADRLPELAFTRRLVDETLRLHHVGWIVTRRTRHPVRLGDWELPAGADILWSPYALHRDPAYYPEPLRFDPDRWLPERPQPPRGAYVPFGAGKRMCIGDQFSLAEAVVLVAVIAARWRLRDTGAEVRAVPEITVHPAPLTMRLEARARRAYGGSPTAAEQGPQPVREAS
ncbi:cytochrome P450 [Phaeacidiphilus oryzae]|uniref:cytochrome P450 n=1 Tax=Phaeacidiphilus oryzae TaxID=348818 RepID=UPI00068C0D40|nr:cytochrome P450 [Phaeacidiphilus oryzae]